MPTQREIINKRIHEEREQQLKRRLRLAIIGVVTIGLLAAGAAVSLKLFAPQADLQTPLKVSTASEQQNVIRSTTGFSVRYNKEAFKPTAYRVQAGSQEYDVVEGNDVLKTDSYGVVRLYSNNLEPGEHALGQDAELSISSNVNEDFFKKRETEYGKNVSKLDATVRFFQPTDTSTRKYTVTKTNTTEINTIEYRHISYTATDTNFLTSQTTSEYFYTVQNDRPYVLAILRTNNNDKEFIAALYGLLSNVTYGEASKTASGTGSSSDQEGTEGKDVNLPSALQDGTALSVAAKNQPAVVRIGGNICSTIQLLLSNKQPWMTIPDACNPVIGSGSIISEDGYISTNGHVTVQQPQDALFTALILQANNGNTEPLNRYLQYLVATNVMSAGQLNLLIDAIKSGSPEAFNKLAYTTARIPKANMRITDTITEYAIQLGRDPIRATQTGSRFRFTYSETVVKAKFVDANYDPVTASSGKYDPATDTKSDVAILKMEGSNFPVIRMGSIDGLATGALITAIGYPGFVDNGLLTKQKYTVPTVTQGRVDSIESPGKNKLYKMVRSDTPIAAGNSGGPAFTSDGRMAGLNTYAVPGCDDDKCFSSSSYFRDVADYKALLTKNRITPKDTSQLTSQWTKGVDLFAARKYSKALNEFQKVKQSYPAFYLADGFIAQATTGAAAERQVLYNRIGVGVAVFVFLLTIVLAIRAARYLSQHRQRGIELGYYAMAGPVAAPFQPATMYHGPDAPLTPQAPAPIPPAFDASIPAPHTYTPTEAVQPAPRQVTPPPLTNLPSDLNHGPLPPQQAPTQPQQPTPPPEDPPSAQ